MMRGAVFPLVAAVVVVAALCFFTIERQSECRASGHSTGYCLAFR